LARSLRAGLPVPGGFALSTADVEAVARRQPDALQGLRVAFAEIGGACAVRSSAIGEDSEAASFAGQHLTVLNVRDDAQIADAVVAVRQSAASESALAYRQSQGLDTTAAVGVVVQRMIDPDCAGVMFTKNPVTGAEERVIEASWGLGEAVVAGTVIPDNYALDGHGRLLRRTAGEKDVALRSTADGGTVEEPVAEDLVNAFCLDATMLAQLHELAARCESLFGKGLDIEWGFAAGVLHLLQCRAMTRNR
jgi:pyruvate,water dikinase